MTDEIKFLLDAANKLRILAMISPEVAEQLRTMADELDAEAGRLERQLRPRH